MEKVYLCCHVVNICNVSEWIQMNRNVNLQCSSCNLFFTNVKCKFTEYIGILIKSKTTL